MFKKLVLLTLLLILSGCAAVKDLLTDPVAEMEKRLGVPVKVMATEPVPGGTVTFYTYKKGNECAEGYIIKAKGPAHAIEGTGPCNNPPRPLQVSSGIESNLTILYGELHYGEIAKVLVKLPGRQEPVEAKVVEGFWYLVLPIGTPPLVGRVRYERIIALDADGEEVDRLEALPKSH